MEEYSNYQEQINGLGEVREINIFREEIIRFIIKLGKRGYGRRRENLHNFYPTSEQFNYQSSIKYYTQHSEEFGKISQLSNETSITKKNDPPFYILLKWNEHQKTIEEKERELSDLINIYDNELKSESIHGEVVLLRKRNQQLEKEVRELRFEVQNLKNQKNNNFEHKVYYSDSKERRE